MKDRYIYTEQGGWIDMAHFLFYAGNAYSEKVSLSKNKENFSKQYSEIGYRYLPYNPIISYSETDIQNLAIKDSVQKGYW